VSEAKTILGISGSARRNSFNTALLRAAAARMPEGFRLEITGIRGIPIYDGDLEAEQGIPEAAQKLKEQAAAAAGLLLSPPEYNHGIPGAFKNAIDWMSRPSKDIARVFGGKPVAIMGATPGAGGTRVTQFAWLPVLRTLGTQAWSGGQYYLPKASEALKEGDLADEQAAERLERFLSGFCAFVAQRQA
jgi:NAD(P)H-dependent FMN reductase